MIDRWRFVTIRGRSLLDKKRHFRPSDSLTRLSIIMYISLFAPTAYAVRIIKHLYLQRYRLSYNYNSQQVS